MTISFETDDATAAPVITRARHREELEKCNEALERFQGSLLSCLTLEQLPHDIVLAAEELREAVKCIGRITGRVEMDDVLDVIFSDFCIGK